MHPTLACLSKASRRALTPKRGNKDFYKGTSSQSQSTRSARHVSCFSVGTRQATLPGGHRTGAPGRFVIRGTSKYRLLDEKVRVFVGPNIEEITQSEVRFSSIYLCPLRNGWLNHLFLLLPFVFSSGLSHEKRIECTLEIWMANANS